MVYKITFDSFTKISEQSGTIQNVGDYIIEMSESPTFDSGILILPNQKSTFNNTDIYLRCIEQGFSSEVRVVPFILDAKGGDVSSVDTTALKSVALVGNALNFYTSSDTAQAAAYSIDIPAEQFIDQAATSFVPNFYFSAILYPDAINPNLNGKPVFVLGVKTKSNDGLSNTVKYSFIDVSKLVDIYVESDTSVTVSDYKIKVNISTDAKNALKLKANGLYADGVTDTATSSVAGLTKLYGTMGANTDGTITQAAITANLNSKLDSDAKAVSATTADKLSTARSLKVSLSSTSAPTFDGSANVTIGVGGILPATYGGTGNANGTVSGAAQLNTSRNFITNLNSTSAGSFNGTASVSAGVTGTLPVANGGTGQSNLDNVIVGKAKSLNSAQNFITNLNSTSAASFNGTASVSAGVTGTLPVANGGTGQSNLDNVIVGAATKAFKDSVGNVITDTYVTKSELSHKLGAVRYGYRIKKDEADPDLRVEYLYDAVGMRPAHMDFVNETFDYGDWQSVWFVRDNKPCMLKSDGTVDYYLNPNNYALKEDGSSSDVANTSYGGNAMAQIPLCWIKRYEDDDYLYEIVSNVQWDENYKAYAHTDAGGNIKPYFYAAMFEASGNASKLRSLSGQTNAQDLTAVQKVAGATANGYNWYIGTWSQRQLINTLLVLIGKSTDTQSVFGNGNLRSNQNITNTSLIQTGTLKDKGQFYGYSTINQGIKVFHIENYWGNQWLRIAGLINNKGTLYVKMTPEGLGYRTNDVSGYTRVGTMPTALLAYIDGMTCSEYGLIPKTVTGSGTTYFCDAAQSNNSQLNYLGVGTGVIRNVATGGAFAFFVDSTPTITYWFTGCALSYV